MKNRGHQCQKSHETCITNNNGEVYVLTINADQIAGFNTFNCILICVKNKKKLNMDGISLLLSTLLNCQDRNNCAKSYIFQMPKCGRVKLSAFTLASCTNPHMVLQQK